MTTYICDRCKKEFKKKSNLDDHLSRKKLCESYEDRLAREKKQKEKEKEKKQIEKAHKLAMKEENKFIKKQIILLLFRIYHKIKINQNQHNKRNHVNKC